MFAGEDREIYKRAHDIFREDEAHGFVSIDECALTEPSDIFGREMSKCIERASIIIILVSQELYRKPHAKSGVSRALERRQHGLAQVLPILLRPTPIRGSGLSQLSFLPANGRAISQWSDLNAAWTQLELEIQVALFYKLNRVAGPALPVIPPQQLKRLKLGQIFCTSGVPNETYAEPREFSRLLALIQKSGQGLAVEGPSGIGKTTAVQKALGSARTQWIRCLEEKSVSRLSKVLKSPIKDYVIIDDFHYLDDKLQKKIAHKIKIMADSDEPGKIILIGVNDVRTSLVRHLPDLGANRLISIRIGIQSHKELSEVLTKGERRANIEFRHRAEIINASLGSFSLLQQLCFNIAADAGITESRLAKKVIAQGLWEILPQMRDHLAADFREPLRRLAVNDAVVPPRGAIVVLLWLLRDAQEETISIERARLEYPFLSPAFDWLMDGNLLRSIQQVQEHFRHLQRILFFDSKAGTLTVEDPRLLFYLRYQDWALFIQAIGVRKLKIDDCGQLVFVPDEDANDARPFPVLPQNNQRPRPTTWGGGDIPATLRKELTEGRVVPIAGPGILTKVRKRRSDAASSSERLLPSWAELLELAAQRLEQERKVGDAQVVRGAIQKTVPSYLDAVRYAREGLGPLWYSFLKEFLDPAYARVDQETLTVPASLWRLGSRLVITTNYDHVLRWSYSEAGRNNLREWHIEASAELSQMLRSGVNEPTLWYLHGSIDDAANLIITPDGYNELYPASDRDGSRYKAALRAFQTLVASRTLLFVGFSGKEDAIWDQLRWIELVFAEAAGPHYIALSEDECTSIQDRIRSIRCLHPLVYKSSLIEFLGELEQHAHPV